MFLTIDAARALARHPRVAAVVRYLVYAGGAAFLVLRVYDTKPLIPSDDLWRRAKALNERVASMEGGVIVPRHPFIPIFNGHKTPQFSEMPYLDLWWAGFTQLKLGAYIDKSHARWALISGTEIPPTVTELVTRYQLEGPLPEAPNMLLGERSTLKYILRLQDDEKDARVLFDFEEPKLEGWTPTGDAFAFSPTTARPKNQSSIAGVVGQRLANSFHPDKRDSAKGTLTSPPFIIDRPKMALRIGGGASSRLKVELRSGGRVERTATTIFVNSESLLKVVWDVSHLQGKEARLVLIDNESGSWGHLLCDRVILFF
jgi:hypothetical protein